MHMSHILESKRLIKYSLEQNETEAKSEKAEKLINLPSFSFTFHSFVHPSKDISSKLLIVQQRLFALVLLSFDFLRKKKKQLLTSFYFEESQPFC